MAYYQHLARGAGDIVSSILDTEVMENEEKTLGNCAFANVQLPLSLEGDAGGDYATAVAIAQWMSKVLVQEHNTFLAILIDGGKWWVRLSAQVYLTEEDFRWGGNVLKEVCERAKKGDWKDKGEGGEVEEGDE